MKGTDFQTLPQKDMMRGVSLCFGEQVPDAAQSPAGKGAVHQLCVSHNCKMQISCLERCPPPSTAG